VSSIDNLIASTRTALDQATRVMPGIGGSTAQTTRIRNLLGALGFENKAAEIGRVAADLEESQAILAGMRNRLDTALAAATAAKAQGGGRGGSSGAGATPTRAAKAPRSAPAHVRRLAQRLPVREQGDKTRILAYSNEDGEAVEYVSGRRRDARDGLKPEYARRFVVKDHAEGHVAADMRRSGGPTHVTVVINNEPCGTEVGCDATIPHIIPKDATMTVYVTDGESTTHYATYTGTGEGIDEQQHQQQQQQPD